MGVDRPRRRVPDHGHRDDHQHDDQVHHRVVEHRVREEGVALLLLRGQLRLVADAAVDYLAVGRDGHQCLAS
jgi:hypothetical protein